MTVAIQVIDDHPLMRDALQSLCVRAGGVDGPVTCNLAATLEEALTQLRAEPAIRLSLLDLNLPGYRGLAAFWTLRERFPQHAVAVISAQCESPLIRDALEGGARGFVPKHTPPVEFERALHLMLAGGRYVPIDVLAAVGAETACDTRQRGATGSMESSTAGPAAGLTAGSSASTAGSSASTADRAPDPLILPRRQREILELLASGLSNKEICRRLSISENTVKTHLATLFDTLGVRSRREIFARYHHAFGGAEISPGAATRGSAQAALRR